MSKQVLVVDDDEDLQALLQSVLENEAYEVITAGDGLDALEELEKSRPNLILLDLMMPRMDGYLFAKELHRRGLEPSIPIIVLSADANARQKVEKMGVDGYISKPFDIWDLLSEISPFLERLIPGEITPQQ